MSQLLDKCVILDITFRRPGLSRRAKSSEATVKCTEEGEVPDQTFVRVTKDILRSATYDAILRADRLLKQRLESLSIPSPLKAGTYMVPSANLEEAYDDVEATKATREGLADQFAAEYPERTEEARTRLGGLFREDNYPDAEAIREAFGVDVRVLEWGPPTKGKVSEVMFAKLRAEFETNIRNAEAECIAALREGLLEMVEGLSAALAPRPDGKLRAIRDSRVEQVQVFLERLSARNVMGDDELAALAGQARDVLGGKSPDAIRDNRDQIREGLSGVVAGLKALVVDRPGRKFRKD